MKILELKHLQAYKLGKDGIKVLLKEQYKQALYDESLLLKEENLDQEFFISNIDYETENICIISDTGFEIDSIPLYYILIIFHPLSDITKEIEHNGEKFVPMKKLFNELIYEGNEDLENIFVDMDKFSFEKKGISNFIHSQNNTDFMNLYVLDKKIVRTLHGNKYGGGRGSRAFDYLETMYLNECLFKWHFDIYGLIEKGLAIDKNTI